MAYRASKRQKYSLKAARPTVMKTFARAATRRARARVVASARASRGEMHSFDTALTADVTTTASINIVNAMVQGSDIDEREGRKIRMKSLMVKLHITNEADLPLYSDLMRVLVIYDKQANKAAPAIGDLLDATTIQANKNINNRDRFTVLGDDVIRLDQSAQRTALTAGQHHWYYERFFSLGDRETTYADAAAGVGSVTTGALYVVYFGTQAAAAADYDVAGTARLRYLP